MGAGEEVSVNRAGGMDEQGSGGGMYKYKFAGQLGHFVMLKSGGRLGEQGKVGHSLAIL